ncbi:RNA-binding protein [Lichenifustis flavocetrariae]|uniref:RNA-binding protein n=1 Tax=Lichenifustis flavocetrariae TaxID=2949735 RepID=A0AA41Z015_9HYPH|nr:RNA-binding protein [Lichenifustis flavocetrariae]MCW6511274.1 RNA-binding protein [Lichenifustis flavocetrariae]
MRTPNRSKRPADVIGNAVHVMRIATGEVEEAAPVDDGKDPAAKLLGAKGGKRRAEVVSPQRRSEIARKAAKSRWEKKPTPSKIDQ